jgi:ubiquinone/menaquinone biosynthesis C-methylase UbiE
MRLQACGVTSQRVPSEHKDSKLDPWYEWLTHSRHAGDAVERRLVLDETERYADKVLAAAQLVPGMTLADIGSGEGLVAFKAIRNTGPALQVILTDISAPLLAHTRQLAIKRGVSGQCTFLECNAENLHGIPDASVDVVTTRAVLAYVADKKMALSEFHRILKPGGRISLAEPIMMDEARATCGLKAAVDDENSSGADPFLGLMHRWKSAQFPDTLAKMTSCPMTNFSERDLVRFAQDNGFADIPMRVACPSMTGWPTSRQLGKFDANGL